VVQDLVHTISREKADLHMKWEEIQTLMKNCSGVFYYSYIYLNQLIQYIMIYYYKSQFKINFSTENHCNVQMFQSLATHLTSGII